MLLEVKRGNLAINGKSELLVKADKGFAGKVLPNVKPTGQKDEET